VSIEDKVLIETRFRPSVVRDDRDRLPGRGANAPRCKARARPDGRGRDAHRPARTERRTFAFRFYDGDDRRIVVLVCDADGGILEEHRAHIAEWLGELYYESGALAYDGEAMLHLLRKKSEEGGVSAGEGDRC